MLPKITIKNDPMLLLLAAVVLCVIAFLVWHGDITGKEGLGLLVALGLPSIFGSKGGDGDGGTGPDPRNEIPPTATRPSGGLMRAADGPYRERGAVLGRRPLKSPPLPSPGPRMMLLAGLLTLSVSATGCSLFNAKNAPKTIPLLTNKAVCVATKIGQPWQVVVRDCFLAGSDLEEYRQLYEASQAGVAAARDEERAKASLSLCPPDFGPKCSCSDAGAR